MAGCTPDATGDRQRFRRGAGQQQTFSVGNPELRMKRGEMLAITGESGSGRKHRPGGPRLVAHPMPGGRVRPDQWEWNTYGHRRPVASTFPACACAHPRPLHWLRAPIRRLAALSERSRQHPDQPPSYRDAAGRPDPRRHYRASGDRRSAEQEALPGFPSASSSGPLSDVPSPIFPRCSWRTSPRRHWIPGNSRIRSRIS